MKNWTLYAISAVACGSMALGAVACTVESTDSAGAAGTAGVGGSAAGAGGAAAGTGGAAAGTGGTATAGDAIDYFTEENGSDNDCSTCLKAGCAAENTGCGAAAEKCSDSLNCIGDAAATQGYTTSYDCAVADCQASVVSEPEANSFLICAATKCGDKCGFTPGFTTTVCK